MTLQWPEPALPVTKRSMRIWQDASNSWGKWVDIPNSSGGPGSHVTNLLPSGKGNHVQLRAENGSGIGPVNQVLIADSTPPPPTNLSAQAGMRHLDISVNQVKRTASDVGANIEYQYRLSASGAWTALPAPSHQGGVVSAHISGLEPGTTYALEVRAHITERRFSTEPTATTWPARLEVSTVPAPTAPPEAVTGLSATYQDGWVTLSWDNPSDPQIVKYQYQTALLKEHLDNQSWQDMDGSDSETVSYQRESRACSTSTWKCARSTTLDPASRRG